jgi:hypothetical protein
MLEGNKNSKVQLGMTLEQRLVGENWHFYPL